MALYNFIIIIIIIIIIKNWNATAVWQRFNVTSYIDWTSLIARSDCVFS